MNNDRLSVSYEGVHSYDIIYAKDFKGLSEELSVLNCTGRRMCIVTDSNVGPLYAHSVSKAVQDIAASCNIFTFPAGEDSKNLSVVKDLYSYLIKNNYDRSDLIIALGGGVTGDLSGFAAATYLRGIRFIQIPTTLLAMSDSSIGGKTGVDFDSYKNMVGAFHMPVLVYMNINSLKTLHEREFYSGFGEIIKHGYIKDKKFISWIKDNKESLCIRNYEALKEMTIKNCLIKKAVVENDPKEKGERALLNFGHTIGHAVEKLMNFTALHGECVAAGMAAAAYISCRRGLISKESLNGLEILIEQFKILPPMTGLQPDDILAAALYDKKKDGNNIRFILLEEEGHAVIDAAVTHEEIKEAAEYMLTLT